MRTSILLLFILLTTVYFTSAQDKQSGKQKDHNNHHQESDYKSEINNEIKALSSEEIEQLLSGSGMGLAKAAELNSYPGPKHVLELSQHLNLTREQQEQTEKIYKKMKTEAVKLGKTIIGKEKELDEMLKKNVINEKFLLKKVMEISKLKGELRFVHLNAHLNEKTILTSEQIQVYNKLRGYSN